jgi:O-antigen ligase
MVRVFVEIPRWLLAASLVFAPWAYGSVRSWAIRDLSVLLASICLFWLLECLLRRRLPALPVVAILVVLFLLMQGWWMALNAHSRFDADLGALLPEASFVIHAPGSANGTASTSAMFLITGLLGVFLFTCELSEHSVWRKRIWVTMVATGFSIAVLGVFQKIGGDSMLALLWEPEKRDLADNFATFRYRGNAGAYLNLVLPLAIGLAVLVFQRPERHWRKALWSVALFVLVLGIQLNPSRAGGIIALALALILGIKIFHFYESRNDGFDFKLILTFTAATVLVGLAVGRIAFLGNWESGWQRLCLLGFDPVDRSPTEIYLRMVPDAGLMGFGPGTFGAVFPPYQDTYDFGRRAVPLFWKNDFFPHAHDDYLQTIIEWGCLGTLLWSILVFGGMLQGGLRYLQNRTSSSHRWLLLCSLLALSGTLVQAFIDFPLQIASIQFYVWVLLGICWGSPSFKETVVAV